MPTIHVELFDAATSVLIGEADLPVEQLPESFAASTTLHLGDADWHVEHAAPMTRDEYVKTGHLVLRMRKIDYIDPNQLLFSLPTIENALPPTQPGSREDCAALHEDDWRQRELVAAAFAAEIAEELDAIRDIYDRERKGPGFAKLHVRKRLPEPLAGVILRVEDVRAALGSPPRGALAVGAEVVVGGFAFAAGDGFVYGREHGGAVAEFGLAVGAASDALVGLIRAHRLVLVDWCGATVERDGVE